MMTNGFFLSRKVSLNSKNKTARVFILIYNIDCRYLILLYSWKFFPVQHARIYALGCLGNLSEIWSKQYGENNSE